MTARLARFLAGGAALACLAGCSDGGGVPDPAPAATPSTSPSAAAPSAPASPGAASRPGVLSARDYRAALRDVALADTARYEQVVVIDGAADPDSLTVLPRSRGAWRISTSESETSSDFLGEDGTVTMDQRILEGGESYFRLDAAGTVFGADCWLRADTDAPELAGTPQSGQTFGLPAALLALDGYRPAGRPGAGTASLGDVLGAVGFQKVASQDDDHVRGRRVPVELQLRDGRFHRAVVQPRDVVSALSTNGTDGPPPPASAALLELVRALPPLLWGIEYSDLGGALRVTPPPADRVLEAGETCPS